MPQILDLTQISVLAEIIIRGGDLHDPKANVRQILQNNYKVFSAKYGVYGLSVIINTTMQQSASYATLIQRNPIFNRKISLSVIGTLRAILKSAGFGMILYVTPSHDLPDHHTLAVFDVDPADVQGQLLSAIYATLPDTAADAIIRAFSQVVNNPHPKPRP